MGLEGVVNRKATTYAHTGTAVAFIISELPGERAEALFFIAMAALVPTAGEQFTNHQQGHRLRVAHIQRLRDAGRTEATSPIP
jgi:hypothetical protein